MQEQICFFNNLVCVRWNNLVLEEVGQSQLIKSEDSLLPGGKKKKKKKSRIKASLNLCSGWTANMFILIFISQLMILEHHLLLSGWHILIW